MRRMQDDAFEKLLVGITTLEEMIRVVPIETVALSECTECGHELLPAFHYCPYCGLRRDPELRAPKSGSSDPRWSAHDMKQPKASAEIDSAAPRAPLSATQRTPFELRRRRHRYPDTPAGHQRKRHVRKHFDTFSGGRGRDSSISLDAVERRSSDSCRSTLLPAWYRDWGGVHRHRTRSKRAIEEDSKPLPDPAPKEAISPRMPWARRVTSGRSINFC